ncbi:glycosyltransferase [Brevibacterium sp. VCM10]|uniref:glycosyltransferase n=1 Tax=Brevibacterium sp. VCM10 TaxID=1381751 RepID=UPI000471FCE4|nr:glycosyltransferase [Brevibacterium sp. VCM10]
MNVIPTAKPAHPHPHRFPHRGILPEGRYYTLTWGITDDFGGMTTVSLERSSAFARLDNRTVEILTLSPELKGRDRQRELRVADRIDRRVKVSNLWQDLTAWSDRKLRRMVGTLDPDPAAADDALKRTGREWSEQRNDPDGRLLQVDRYHDRGHLLVVDRQDVKKRGRRGGRLITLFDREQTIIAQWATAREFYQAWLDVVIGTKPSYLICDSAFVGNLIHGYRRENIILCQVVHNHHLNSPHVDGDGELSAEKFGFLRSLDAFDLVTTLTDVQRHDMNELELSAGKISTVSNLTHQLNGDPAASRPRGTGAMIARLVPQKRVEDAIEAIAGISDAESAVTLDVYGEGEDRAMLTGLIADRDLAERVRLRGHVSGAKSAFHTSSFSVLTSRYEGQGLVVLESMSAGCIPICYAVEYGPADIIDHGVNGFLVPAGDVAALSDTIATFLTMPEAEVKAMRRNAIDRAADFAAPAIVDRWGQVLSRQRFTPIREFSELRAELLDARVTGEGIDLSVALSGMGTIAPVDVYVSWTSRVGSHYGRVRANSDERTASATIPPEAWGGGVTGYLDLSVDVAGGRGFGRARISSRDDAIGNNTDRIRLYTTKHGNLSGHVLDAEADSAANAPELTSTS